MVFASLKEWPERWSLFPFDSIYKLKFIVCSVAWRCLSRCNYADSCTKLKQQLLPRSFTLKFVGFWQYHVMRMPKNYLNPTTKKSFLFFLFLLQDLQLFQFPAPLHQDRIDILLQPVSCSQYPYLQSRIRKSQNPC